MGDGLLAIFPDRRRRAGVCATARKPRREARNILALSARQPRRIRLAPFWRCVGEVLYGIVGGGRRLDFTVIGPAINLAARLERLARELGRSIIASAAFAGICGERLTPLGSYALRDISAVQPAFGLPEENAPAGRNNHDATIGHPEARPALS